MKKLAIKWFYRTCRRFPFLEERLLFLSGLPANGKLIDVGCGDGQVLKRFLAVRPDLKIAGVDKADFGSRLPAGAEFRQADLEKDRIPYPDGHFDAVTMIHLVEHLKDPGEMLKEVFRVLKPGGGFYLETPDEKSLKVPSLSTFLAERGGGPLNFHDDPTHLRLYRRRDLLDLLQPFYPAELMFGLYRNYLYAAISPLLVLAGALARRRRWVVVGLHNLIGWSMYCRGRKGPLPAAAVAHPGRRRLARLADLLLCAPVRILRTLNPGGVSRKGQCRRPPRSILVIRVDHIGDVLLSTPVYEALKGKYPLARLTVLVGPWAAELLRHNPFIDRIITLDCPWWSGKRGKGAGIVSFTSRYLKLLLELRAEHFDIGIDLRGDLRHILLFLFLPGVKERVAYDRSGGGSLLTAAVPSPGFFALSELEKNRRLLREGLGVSVAGSVPRLYWGKADDMAAAAILRAAGIGSQDFKVILSPSARSPLRMWQPDKFATVAVRLAEEFAARVILIGGPDAVAAADEITALARTGPINLTGKTTLLQAAALCAACRLFIGVEGGLMHIAAAAGNTVVALYGPMKPELTRPDLPDFFAVYHPLPCSPCLQLKCPYSSTPRGKCMESISLDDVMGAVRLSMTENRDLKHPQS